MSRFVSSISAGMVIPCYTVAGAGRAITAALLDVGSVLVDLDAMQLKHPSRLLVFTVALDQAGGWPRARLVLYGGAPAVTRALDDFGVTKTVPCVPTLPEALIKIATRPPRVRRGVALEPRLRSRDLWTVGNGGQRQRDAVLLADKWGVEYLRHTHKVWAVITSDSPRSAGSAGFAPPWKPRRAR